MIKKAIFLLGILLFCGVVLWGKEARIEIEPRYLAEVPNIYPAMPSPWSTPAIQAIYYDGPEYQGKPSKVFAFLGMPKVASGEKIPAIVLVHGGGGTAFYDWVNLWVSRGYAAIAMDLCGSIPVRNSKGSTWLKVDDGAGPDGWDAAFTQLDRPLKDQWPYYAVNAIARARTLLGSLPLVDPDKIGITGISWGGYLTCITAGTDSRYAFAAPIYGCGFLHEDSYWQKRLQQPEMAAWIKQCEPSVYLSETSMPIMWVSGTNDFAYPLKSLEKSAQLVKNAPVTRSITLRMPHAHGGAGELPEVIYTFAEQHVRSGAEKMPEILDIRLHDGKLSATAANIIPTAKATLNYTTDSGNAPELFWQTIPAELDDDRKTISVTLPPGVKECFLNLENHAGAIVSSRLFSAEF